MFQISHYNRFEDRLALSLAHAFLGYDKTLLNELDCNLYLRTVKIWQNGLPPIFRLAIKILLYLMNFTPLLFFGSFVPFTWMTPARQQRALRFWEESRLPIQRDLFKLVKSIFLFPVFEQSIVLKRTGYEFPVSKN